MARFNFTQITGKSKANITDVMDNFNKIEQLGITGNEVNTKIAEAVNPISENYRYMSSRITTMERELSMKQSIISVGIDEPTSETSGNIYIQYFE